MNLNQYIYRKESLLLAIVGMAWFYLFRIVKQEGEIHVMILVYLDKALLFNLGLPTDILGAYTHPFLDIFAAIPYLFHNLSPFFYVLFLYKTQKREEIFRFLWNLMLFNFCATLTHVLFPTAPPWYYHKYGDSGAYPYEVGQPGGLARVDELIGEPIITVWYQQNKIVFGACPSIHAGWPFLIATFLPREATKEWASVFNFYAVWMWWAAMYLQHHYLIDLLVAALYLIIIQKWVWGWVFPEYVVTKPTHQRSRNDGAEASEPVDQENKIEKIV